MKNSKELNSSTIQMTNKTMIIRKQSKIKRLFSPNLSIDNLKAILKLPRNFYRYT